MTEMTAALHFQPLAQVFAETMLNSIVQGIAIALFGWLSLRLLGRQNSSTRFAVWFCALIAIAALPLFASVRSNHAGALLPSAIRLPGHWALILFLLWTVIASAGLISETSDRHSFLGAERTFARRTECRPVTRVGSSAAVG